jgi:hypothetical protein
MCHKRKCLRRNFLIQYFIEEVFVTLNIRDHTPESAIVYIAEMGILPLFDNLAE